MASKTNTRESSRLKRKKRIRKKLSGSPERPRLTVFRSDKHIYAQIIDDTVGSTLATASTLSSEYKQLDPLKGKVEAAKRVGELILAAWPGQRLRLPHQPKERASENTPARCGPPATNA